MISSLAGDEDNYLVKIMIMVREFLSGLVFKMKKSELFVQVSCFFLSDRTVLIITYLPPISAMIFNRIKQVPCGDCEKK